MNAVATPARAKSVGTSVTKTQPKTTAPALNTEPKFTFAAVEAAFGQVEVLLGEAYMTDEDHAWSGDSDRLLDIAHGLAHKAEIELPIGPEMSRVAFNIAALIRAARLVPGDGESPQRKALIDQAAVHLNWLTECDLAGSDCCDPGVPRPERPTGCTPVKDREKLASTAWLQACQALEVLQVCVENYQGPDTVRGTRTVLKTACETLGSMFENNCVNKEDCDTASNLLAQAIALASMLTEEVNGNPWEQMLDAGLSLMVMSKEALDRSRKAMSNG